MSGRPRTVNIYLRYSVHCLQFLPLHPVELGLVTGDKSPQNLPAKQLRAGRGVDDDNATIIFGATRIRDPLGEESSCVLADTGALRGGRRAVDGGSLARHRLAGAQPLVQYVDVVHFALDVPVGVAMLSRQRATLLEHLGVIAGTVHDDAANTLLHEILGEIPLQEVCMLGRLVERENGWFEKRRPEDVVVNNDAADALPK